LVAAAAPLSHHRILELVAPFTRAGWMPKVAPDRLDDTEAQLAADHLIGASPRGWEDVSRVLQAGLSEHNRRLCVQGRIGAANAAEFFGVLKELRAGADVLQAGLSEHNRRLCVQGRIGAANAAEFFGVLKELRAGAGVLQLLAAAPGASTLALLPTTLDGLYRMVYGLIAACTDKERYARACSQT